MKYIVITILIFLSACTPALTRPPLGHGLEADKGYTPPEPVYSWTDCNGWINDQFAWSMTAKGAGILAGVGALSASFDQPAARYTAIGAGVTFAALATVAIFAADHYTAQFSRYCGAALTPAPAALPVPQERFPNGPPPWSPAGAIPSPTATGAR